MPQGGPVEPSLALECTTAYESLYKNPTSGSVTALTDAYTDQVSFDDADFRQWMQDISTEDYDNIRICFGRYTQNYVNSKGLPTTDEGRLSCFIWPYKGNVQAALPGKVADIHHPDETMVQPYNLGSLTP